jgi:hypothetical protein
MNNKIFVRVMCIILGVLMVAGAISLIAVGIAPQCQAA